MNWKKLSAAALAAMTVTIISAAPVLAAEDIPVNDDISVSGDYDWTRFANDHITLNVYNWGLYISDGSDDSVNVLSAFEDLTGIKVNYTTFDSNESLYAKMKSGGASYDVIAMAPYYAGDAITMIDENPDLAFVHPEEGVNFFVDSMCIPANAKNKEAAEMFINYMCETSVGLANCDFIGYSTPLTAVWDELDDDLKYSEIAYPGEDVMEKAEVFNTLPDDINAAMDAQWSEMKSYEEGGSGWMVVVMLVVAIAISAFNIWRKLRKKSRDNY